MTLEELFKHGMDSASCLFSEQGEIHPMWIGENAIGRLIPIVVHIPDKESKDEIVKNIKAIFKKHRIVRYVSLLEAWIIEPKTKELPDSIRLGGSVSQHPDRREVIWITAEDKTGFISGMYYILRPEHGKPVLSPFKRLPKADHQEGRFVGLLAE